MNAAAPRIRIAMEIGVLALLYVVTARLGPLLAIPPGNITPAWIPSGIILGAVLWRG
jgi:integral membrane sensor domain MASE1